MIIIPEGLIGGTYQHRKPPAGFVRVGNQAFHRGRALWTYASGRKTLGDKAARVSVFSSHPV
jgi:hypothetical protein